MDKTCDPGALLVCKFQAAWPHLDERARRVMAASEAMSMGRGGVSAVSRACGLSRNAIHHGINELRSGEILPAGRVRRVGAGRKPIARTDPGIMSAIEALMDGSTRGDPQSPLRWTNKSTRALAAELKRQRHPVSHAKVAQLLHEDGYSLQSNRKTLEATDHPDHCGLRR